MFSYELTVSTKFSSEFKEDSIKSGMKVELIAQQDSVEYWNVVSDSLYLLQEFIYKWDNGSIHTFFCLVEEI